MVLDGWDDVMAGPRPTNRFLKDLSINTSELKEKREKRKKKKMVLIEKLWDDVMAGPQPDKGLGKRRKSITLIQTHGGEGGEGASKSYQRSLSMPGSGLSSPGTPGTPVTPNTYSPTARKDNVWRSVFNPGSNIATKRIGAEVFDKPSHPNAPTALQWGYPIQASVK
ncbi:hypothetical protein H5410_013772 [Solanum commersonii]|uniref:Uncharacterized protein n=1 Tax=Solanum commersonii TaxID=4109 RepID=A0A9J5ZPC8_SOLCO|nr:hypothetical protein H5410_013772 [Solanum commersonii]